MTGAPESLACGILRERRSLPAQALGNAPYRRWATAVCAAETAHARDDFWACVHRLGVADRFDRDDGFGCHEAPFRLAHEAHAFAALSWLVHLQAHEADRRGPWAALRWDRWDSGRRRLWWAERRRLWAGFLRNVERYRAARRMLDA